MRKVYILQFAIVLVALAFSAVFSVRDAGAQGFVDRILRSCASGATARAMVIANPNNTGNVAITTCTGGSVTINGVVVVPGGGTINPTNTFIPYRSAAATFSDSPLARTSATVITSTAAFNGPVGGVNTATYSFAAEPTLGFFRGAAGQLSVTSAGTIGWFDINGWHGFGTKVEVFNDTATSTDGFIATTNGSAAAGVQKLSPRIRLSGSGWKTNAVAGAQLVDWIIENLPVQGAANPSTNLVFSSQVNAGGYTSRMVVTSAGLLTVASSSIGIASATSLALGGATIGTNALAITGTIKQGSVAASAGYGLSLTDATFGNMEWGNATVKGQLSYSGTLANLGSTSNHPFGLTSNNLTRAVLDTSGNFTLGSSAAFAFTDGTATAGTQDTFLSRSAAGVLRSGTTATNSSGSFLARTYLTDTNCLDNAGAAACGSASAGSVVVDAGATTVVVSTTSVTANSQIFVQYDSSLGARLGITCNVTPAIPAVTARTAATSFTITIPAAPVTNPACYSYRILN